MDGCDRNTRDAGRGGEQPKTAADGDKEGGQAWLRQKHAGRGEGGEQPYTAADGDAGDEGGQGRPRLEQEGAGPGQGQENQAWMTPWVIHIQTR